MEMKSERLNENLVISYYDDGARGKYLFDVFGKAEVFEVPKYITKLKRTAFHRCEGLRRVIIPEDVREIERDVFSAFGPELEIMCCAPEKPDGYFEGRFREHYNEDIFELYNIGFGSWLGGGRVFYCEDQYGDILWGSDEPEYIEENQDNLPRVIWGYKLI